MGQIDIPTDPAPNGYVSCPYDSEIAASLEYLKRECDSQEGWSNIGTTQGVRKEKKSVPGDSSGVPLVRGMATVNNVNLEDFIPMVTHPGARKFWDPRYVSGHALEKYSRRSYKFYTLQKGGFMVQPRDFVGVQDLIREDDGTFYLTQCSVPNDEKTPDVSGKTRGTLTAAGWRLRPNGNDLDVSYIVKVNPNGSLPTTIVNTVVQEIPTCVVNVINWIKSDGYIPYVVAPTNPSTIFRIEEYVHDKKREYSLWITCKGGEELEIKIDSAIKYKNGYDVTLENDAKGDVEVVQEGNLVRLKLKDESDGKKLDVIIHAK